MLGSVPKYSLVAYTLRTTDRVSVNVDVGSDDSVTEAHASEGPYELRSACESAARMWKFEEAASSWSRRATLRFDFSIKDSDPNGYTTVFRSPYEVAVIAERDNTVILADPPVGPIKKKQSK